MRRSFLPRYAGRPAHTLIGTYLLSALLVQYAGLFGPASGSLMQVLHRPPVLAGIAAFLVNGTVWGLAAWSAERPSGPRRTRITPFGLAYAGLLLIAAGILLGSATRFEGRLALTEGQEAALASDGFEAGTLTLRKFSRAPGGSLLLRSAGEGMQGADVLYRPAGGGEAREFRIRSLLPAWNAGYRFTIRSAGFAPHVFLIDRNSIVIDDFYAVLQLSPAGAEDSFRFDGIIPHTFFLRYYPEASLAPDAAGAARAASEPLFHVRIARNLDIVANQYAAPGEAVRFDKLVLSLEDMRKWVEVQVVRDPGMYLLWPGMLLTLGGAAAIAVRRRSGGAGK
jgi:hypothetical protein